jgi:hypothetical protein
VHSIFFILSLLTDLTAPHFHGHVRSVQLQHFRVYDHLGTKQLSLTGKETWQFTASGNILSLTTSDNEHHQSTSIRNVYTTGRLTQSDTTDLVHSYNNHRSLFHYDSSGRCSELVQYNVRGDMYSKTRYTYYTDTTLHTEIIYNSHGSKEYSTAWQYEYDDHHRLTSIYKHYESYIDIFQEANDKLTFDTLGRDVQYTYNTNNDPISCPEQHTTWRYKFDSHHNPIERIRYEPRFDTLTPTEITRYTYTYYP